MSATHTRTLLVEESPAEALLMQEALAESGSVRFDVDIAERVAAAREHRQDPARRFEQEQLLGDRDSRLAAHEDRAFMGWQGEGLGHPLAARRSPERVRLGKELPRALEQGRFQLAYQPIVRLSDGALRGFEALLRCSDPMRGMVPPADLIPVAEETGLIVPLTAWVFAESCWRLGDWLPLRGEDAPDFAMHINISHSCLAEPRLAARLHAALDANDIPGSRLVFELTESVCAEPANARRVLQQVREMGVRVALDDFGTGYNSLGTLQQLPIDILKIDRSFISRLGTGESPEVLRAIFGLAERLGLEVIAEGVETIAQLAELRSLGCDLAQGYLFAAPCEPEVARELTRGSLAWPF